MTKKKMSAADKHILTARTLSSAAEVTEKIDERGREIDNIMKRVYLSKKERTLKR